MTIHKNPRNEIERLHVSRKERVREFAGIEDSMEVSIQRLENYIK